MSDSVIPTITALSRALEALLAQWREEAEARLLLEIERESGRRWPSSDVNNQTGETK